MSAVFKSNVSQSLAAAVNSAVTGSGSDPVHTQLAKAHILITREPETIPYCGILYMGNSEIVDIPNFTAATDGRNKFYGREFFSKLSMPETVAVVLHECLHVFLLHSIRFNRIMKEDPVMGNAALDYVVNAIIVGVNNRVKARTNKDFAVLPKQGLYDAKFAGWSAQEVYDFLTRGKPPVRQPQPGQGQPQPQSGQGKPQSQQVQRNGDESVTVGGKTFPLKPQDSHDEMTKRRDKTDTQGQNTSNGYPDDSETNTWERMNAEMDGDEQAQLERDVQAAARQGAIIAGQMGVKLPRAVTELLKVPTDWRKELEEWAADNMHGKSSLSWRSYRANRVVDDLFFPAHYDEAMGEVIIPIDTSGSIGDKELREFSGHIAQICEARNPSMVRVLWWDTEVHGEQVFTPGDYANIATALKPQGGGGTRVSCVSEYITKKNYNPQAVVVLTDGYVENDIKWDSAMPTLWCITDNTRFVAPPGGRVISIKPE